MTSFFSPGKVILSGEHSVVYGYPALVMSLPLGITVELVEGKGDDRTLHIDTILEVFRQTTGKKLQGFSFHIKSNLPQNSGLGSSAALAFALLQAAAHHEGLEFSQDQYFEMVQRAEVFAHGTPSGIDASAVVFQGLLSFQKKETGLVREPLKISRIPDFVLIQSGKAQETTKQMVEFAAGHENKKVIARKIGEITVKIRSSLENGDFDPKLLAENEKLLEEWGVVGKKAKDMIGQIEDTGGFAKIAGAGGVSSGSGIILAFHQNLESLIGLAKHSKWKIIYQGKDRL